MKCIHKRIASFILATLIVMGLSIPAYAVDYSIDYKLLSEEWDNFKVLSFEKENEPEFFE